MPGTARALLALAVAAGCVCSPRGPEAVAGAPAPAGTAPATGREGEREAMVRDQLELRGIRDARVLAAMRAVPRHEFVPDGLRHLAYEDGPLPIGEGQTISQPYIVAFMAEALGLAGGERVLEVGSGSGYAAAVLSRIAADVYGIELEPVLYERSVATLAGLGYGNVHVRLGDGFAGWPEAAPFDAILISCAAERVPPPLWEQLRTGGRLIYPQGAARGPQELVLVTKTPEGPVERALAPVRFVPMRRAP